VQHQTYDELLPLVIKDNTAYVTTWSE